MASSKNFFKDSPLFDEFWKSGDGEIIHFVGKDILYFHALFWPGYVNGHGYKTPQSSECSWFITVNGEKMSKSRGLLLKASTFKNIFRSRTFSFLYRWKIK